MKPSLSDLDDWGYDLIIFRLSAHHAEALENLLGFLAQENHADVVAVVSQGEEDLGVGAVARGAANFILHDATEYVEIGTWATQARRRRLKPAPNVDVITSTFAGDQPFHTVCQPIIDLKKECVVGWEFLSRGPQGPLNQPSHFFRWGERHDRLLEFDLSCLDAGLEAARSSQCTGRFHFNLFPQTLAAAEIAPFLEKITQFTDQKICIEISESAISKKPHGLLAQREHLRHLGIDLAIDDIGFQARGLSHVRELKPDVLKIDRRVVSHIRQHQAKRDIVTSALHLGESLGAMVIAEGVELESELKILEQLGVLFAQGYFWGKPTLPDQATMRLRLGGSNQEQS